MQSVYDPDELPRKRYKQMYRSCGAQTNQTSKTYQMELELSMLQG